MLSKTSKEAIWQHLDAKSSVTKSRAKLLHNGVEYARGLDAEATAEVIAAALSEIGYDATVEEVERILTKL